MTRDQIIIAITPHTTFEISISSEHAPIKGNCSAVNPKVDAATEQWICDQLMAGNDWAWCVVRVVAIFTLGSNCLTAADSLGCCSYESESDFTMPGGYYEDMKNTALGLIADELIAAAVTLQELEDGAQ